MHHIPVRVGEVSELAGVQPHGPLVQNLTAGATPELGAVPVVELANANDLDASRSVHADKGNPVLEAKQLASGLRL